MSDKHNLDKLMQEIRRSQSRGNKLPDPGKLIDEIRKSQSSSYSKKPDLYSLMEQIRSSQKRSYSKENPGLIISELRKKKYEKPSEALIDINQISPKYQVALTESGDDTNPFIISLDLARIVNEEVKPFNNDFDKAEAIYGWMMENISYDDSRSPLSFHYVNSDKLLKSKKGICLDMAILYVTMARSVGLDSYVADVKIDNGGKPHFLWFGHACALVKINGRDVLVDPAYGEFDIKHRKYRLWKDKDVRRHYNYRNMLHKLNIFR